MKTKLKLLIILLMLICMGCSNLGSKEEIKEKVDKEETQNDVIGGETTSMENVTTLILDTTEKYQIFESFGTSGCWWSQYVGGWDKAYKESGHTVRDEIAMLLFDKEYEIGLTSYRYNIGAGSADSGKGTYSDYHRRARSFETAPFTYDWSKDPNAVWFMKKAVELGVEEIVMFCNSPLERLTINGKAQMEEGATENILPENYDDFATYVMDVAEHFVTEGIPVKFISPINEPQWEWTTGQEGCHYDPSKLPKVYRAFLTELESRPALAGVSLSGPESGEWKGMAVSYTSALLNDTVLSKHFTHIDNHSYWSDKTSKVAFKSWMDANFPDVAIRMSEWCEMVNGSDVTMDSAFHLAEVIAEDLTVLDAVAWQNWVAVAPGGYRDGLIYVNEAKKAFNPIKRLWGYGNYSKFIRPGYQRIDVSGISEALTDLKPVAFLGQNDAGEEELVLVMINEEGGNKSLSLDILHDTEYNCISVYETSENNNLRCIKTEKYQMGTTIEIAAQSITTIILSKAGE